MPPDPAALGGAGARSRREAPASGGTTPGSSATSHTLGQVLERAIARLRESGSDTARLDAELLAAHVLGIDRTGVIAHPEAALSSGHDARFEEAIARRERGEPVAYIRGLKEFHGLAFSVDERALIPRPDTELLVDLGVARAASTILGKGRCRIVDVGTGSGAVCVALASALRGRGMLAATELLATDVSPGALALATENAVVHGLADAIRFVHADLLPEGEPPADLVVANLPYVPSADVPGLPVAARFEPRLALDGGPDGLAVVRRLLALLPGALDGDGTALLEIGAGEADLVLAAARDALPDRGLVIHPDLAGIARVLEVVAG
jgi:release factor glutamine methyltransferase